MSQKNRCFPIELVTWGQLYRLCKHLSFDIKAGGFLPEVVIAIARGGYVPARIICDFLGISMLSSIRVVHYGAGAEEKSAHLVTPVNIDISGKQVLLVDDLTDKGVTMDIAMEHLNSQGPKKLCSAVLYHKKGSLIEPDFFVHKIIKWRWIIFPWAVIEDLGAFIKGMHPTPSSPEEASQIFLRNYQVQVPIRILRDIYQVFPNTEG